jgi:hypothetical protein
LQVPGILSEEVAAIDNLQTQISHVGELRYIGGEFEHFTGAQRHTCVCGRGTIARLDGS